MASHVRRTMVWSMTSMCVRTHMARSTGCGFIFRCVALLKVQFGCICTGLGRSDCSCCAQKHLAEVILLRSSCRIILLSPLPSGLIVSVCRFLTIARHLHCNSIALRQRRHAGCPSFASHCFLFFLFFLGGRAIHYTYMQRKKPQVSNGRPLFCCP